MKIGLIDVDSHNFPNIPLMKLSAWHKTQGDSAEWYQPMFSGHLDKVYMSKVFSFTPDYEYYVDADETVKGGSGYAITLRGGTKHTTNQGIQTCCLRLITFIQTIRFIHNSRIRPMGS